jgi:hypothetical protein
LSDQLENLWHQLKRELSMVYDIRRLLNLDEVEHSSKNSCSQLLVLDMRSLILLARFSEHNLFAQLVSCLLKVMTGPAHPFEIDFVCRCNSRLALCKFAVEVLCTCRADLQTCLVEYFGDLSNFYHFGE